MSTEPRSKTGKDTSAPREWRRWLTRAGLGALAAAVVLTPWWGPRALATLDFFHVRKIEFDGVRYANPSELVALLALDTMASVWTPLEPLGERVAGHAMVTSARVARRLPATLLVSVVERTPVALIPSDRGLAAVDAEGQTLPIDPSSTPVDVPVLAAPDSALLQLLDRIRGGSPALWSRLAGARREGAQDIRLDLGEFDLRARYDVTVARLADILPVEADLAQRRLRAVELDLRFRDQVIARLP
jgi:cell division protein FtsQ